jgi:hypothetical protein
MKTFDELMKEDPTYLIDMYLEYLHSGQSIEEFAFGYDLHQEHAEKVLVYSKKLYNGKITKEALEKELLKEGYKYELISKFLVQDFDIDLSFRHNKEYFMLWKNGF